MFPLNFIRVWNSYLIKNTNPSMYHDVSDIGCRTPPGFAPKPGASENVTPTPVFALAPHFRSRSQVTRSKMMLETLTVASGTGHRVLL